jgi:hypothetical protein
MHQIVPAESARFGMPGDHENVVKLNADHSGVCKFGSTLEDQDNFKLVRSNIRDLYKEALRTSELSTLPLLRGSNQAVYEDSLQKRFAKLKGGNT